ncbi:circadian clock protein KaiC [Methylotetracoccus oryzae]|uniref:circadian clock protein KaiC n=1 Tax=Methylotetracoccus oryzae TaxID=1919059 RepID=UPI0011182687|nr:circadian clock protein KaiC [Methylotetracoccus oryzae]
MLERPPCALPVEGGLEKCPTGIRGLDEITGGGLPRGRSTLVCGGAGSGKTLLAMEFIVRGIREFGEPGLFLSFEETIPELIQNVESLGFGLAGLIEQNQLALDHIQIERAEIEETGEYDLEGLFIRIDHLLRQTGARRIAVDSLEALFAGVPSEAILRSELRRLFRWFKTKGVTAVITAEQGRNSLSRHNLEEYISDCVIFLDHRVAQQIATRRLRVIKYRGSAHGSSEYPTMIDERGLSVLPISSLSLNYAVSTERVPTGIPRLDTMLDGKGYYRGSTILVSGSAGTGKSSLAAAFVNAACQRGEACLYLAFEEAPAQIRRNMASIGFDLGQWESRGLLRFNAVRSTAYGLEEHLVQLHKLVHEYRPTAVVIDPISNLCSIADFHEVKAMLSRVIDFLKNLNITTILTSLEEAGSEKTDVGISSLMDTWLLLRNIETSGERNRLLFVLKSRGMAHSNQVREFRLSDEGIQLTDVYNAAGAVLTGSARLIAESHHRAEESLRRRQVTLRQNELEQRQRQIRSQIEELQLQASYLKEEMRALAADEQARLETLAQELGTVSQARQAD